MHKQLKGNEAAPEKKGTKGVIYVVDDEPMLLELAEAILEPLGFEVKTFRDPDSALEAYRAASVPPAVVVTDYSMQQMSGQQLLNACRRICPHQKVLMVSGTVEEDVFDKKENQPTAFLPKPYQAHELLEAVAALLPH
jgi:DNA-binding NtrC family response regulator